MSEILVEGSILQKSGVQITPISLTLTDPDLAWEHFEDLGAFLGKMNRACSWWVGDLILYGEQLFGHNHAQIESALGLAPQTIANRASVCRHIPPSQRRAALPFGVHAEVAYLEPKERDRWLDKAELGQWTRAKLRYEMRGAREIDSDGSGLDLEITGKINAANARREEHLDNGVPAATRDFLGEPVLNHPIQCPHCRKVFVI